MSSFVIEGGYRLSGEIVPQGAKNEALEVICATLLTPEKVTIHNVPDILDVNNLIQLLRDMRVKVEHPSADTYTFQADDVDMEYLRTEEFLRKSGSLRGSVMIVGPLVARFGRALLPKPGGDKIDKLGIIPDAFRRLGITVEQRGDDIYIPRHDSYEIDTFIDGSIMTIADAPWPGLTPDLLSVFLVVATQSVGSVLIHQKMFESRLFFVDKLIDMGAQIILCDPHRATVIGLGNRFKLRGSTMVSPDIRAGIALLIAAMSAEGTSTIHNIDQIDRGYQGIDKRLNRIGARITRI